jgi:hypothetical protein
VSTYKTSQRQNPQDYNLKEKEVDIIKGTAKQNHFNIPNAEDNERLIQK